MLELKFLDTVELTVALLCQFPEAGGLIPVNRSDAAGLRAKLLSGFGNYVVLYFITDTTIDIARVIRGGPDLDRIALNAS